MLSFLTRNQEVLLENFSTRMQRRRYTNYTYRSLDVSGEIDQLDELEKKNSPLKRRLRNEGLPNKLISHLENYVRNIGQPDHPNQKLSIYTTQNTARKQQPEFWNWTAVQVLHKMSKQAYVRAFRNHFDETEAEKILDFLASK